jgi:hypothetical protein
VLGFEGLTAGLPPGKEDEWPTVTLARLLGAFGAIDEDTIVDDDQVEQQQKANYEEMRANSIRAALNYNMDDDLDFDDV